MATESIPTSAPLDTSGETIPPDTVEPSMLVRFLMPLASLKLTVVLFALSIFIVLAGTFAQAEKDVWQVIAEYFRINFHELFQSQFPWIHLGSAFAWIDFQIFFPPSFFPSKPVVPGGFYFPKGWLIGLVLGLNLGAAHLLRFKVRTRGLRLVTGCGVLVLGGVITWLVIVSGANLQGFQETGQRDWSLLWSWIKAGLVLLGVVAVIGAVRIGSGHKTERGVLIGCAIGLGILTLWLFYEGDAARLGDSSMRILWQLIKGSLCGVVLLAACILIFQKRAGMVLLHGGIGLIMLSELLVGTTAEEAQMPIREGETVNYVTDIREVEVAVVDTSHPEHDEVVAIPESILLKKRNGQRSTIQDENLPFDVEVVRFIRNSTIRDMKPDEKNLATAGMGLLYGVHEVRPASGTDRGGIDIPSIYVTFHAKETGASLGTYLLSLHFKPQQITVGSSTYDLALRHKRTYKPYTMRLIDVRKDDYLGTNTPRNYSSDVQLVENDETRRHLSANLTGGSSRTVDRSVHIWMNNPLRYAGETFYQSGYSRDPKTGVETTTLQVVTNAGWMIPYVACMIVATGMFAHFWIVLFGFLNSRAADGTLQTDSEPVAAPSVQRRKESRRKRPTRQAETPPKTLPKTNWIIPLIVVALCGAWIGSKSRMPTTPSDAMDIYGFGKLPLVYEGRVKPFETLARNTLRILSDRQSFVDSSGQKQPAIRWLLDVIARPHEAEKHAIFRIQNLEVLNILELKPRSGWRYSVEELLPQINEFEKQYAMASRTAPEDRSVFQRKIVELKQKMSKYSLIAAAFHPPPLPSPPELKEFNKDQKTFQERLQKFQKACNIARMQIEELDNSEPPLAVPIQIADDKKETLPPQLANWIPERKEWETYAGARTYDFIRQKLFHRDANFATVALQNLFGAYARNDATTFNRELEEYRSRLENDPPGDLNLRKVSFEAFFDHFEPFYYSSVLYMFAFVLTALSWLGWSRPLSRAALWMIAFTFGVHTFALIARIDISGRPPVTNLYSSAVFIGWGGVLLGWVLEILFRRSIGNVIASVTGFSTLLVAHMLAGNGDTFTVLQAVLDTQFWLATHVVCITLGYATTYVAGLLGVLYILRGTVTPSLTPTVAKDLSRMIHGTICFAIFFSFVGTVLGGLWADDSWGRFWGWDPKENGALIIVLWNALVLHAYWSHLVEERGLAVLAVAGNVATSWSWFGVNELGVGLHSYGFTEGVLMALGAFVFSQLAVMAFGMMPEEMWWSHRRQSGSGQTTV